MFLYFSIISLRILCYVFLSYSSAPSFSKILIFSYPSNSVSSKKQNHKQASKLETQQIIKYNLCCLCTFECVGFHCSVVQLPGETPLQTTHSPPPTAGNYQQFLLLLFSDGGSFCLPVPLCRDLVWLELIQVLSILWKLLLVHMCTNSAMSRKHCFPCSHLLPLALRLFLPSLPF